KTGALAHAGYPHCYFLQILVDFGLFGFGIFCLFVFSIFKKALISKQPFKIASLSPIVAHIFTNLFAFPSITEVLLLWFFVGIIFSGQKPSSGLRNRTLGSVFAIFVLLFTLIPLYTDFVFKKATNLPPRKALNIYKKMIFPQDYHLMNAGRRIIELYHETKDEKYLDEAESFFKKILAQNPYSALALNGMGFVWKEHFKKDKSKESFNKAKDFFTKALSIDPFLEAVYLNYGQLCERAYLFEEEAEIYKRGLEIYPENEKFLFNLGVSYANSGNLKEAVSLWNKLKAKNPDYPKLKRYLEKAKFLLEGR
ncbi:MAG: tetratricopeptide repeat protein, partial [Elusimicrobia bacterium]|nr:tetratricopeptide repeat protein [Elusimicrobiota bacterium]